MSRPSQTESACVQTFVRSPDYSCVHVQTFVRFSWFPDHVNLNARHPRRAFIWVWTYRLSVWDLNLGDKIDNNFILLVNRRRSNLHLTLGGASLGLFSGVFSSSLWGPNGFFVPNMTFAPPPTW